MSRLVKICFVLISLAFLVGVGFYWNETYKENKTKELEENKEEISEKNREKELTNVCIQGCEHIFDSSGYLRMNWIRHFNALWDASSQDFSTLKECTDWCKVSRLR